MLQTVATFYKAHYLTGPPVAGFAALSILNESPLQHLGQNI